MAISTIKLGDCLPFELNDFYSGEGVLVLANPAVGRPPMNEDPNLRQRVYDHLKKVIGDSQEECKIVDPLGILCASSTEEAVNAQEVCNVAALALRALRRNSNDGLLVRLENAQNGLAKPFDELKGWLRITQGSSLVIAPAASISDIIPSAKNLSKGAALLRTPDGWRCIHERF